MTTYLDVGVQQVQGYLGRSHTLKGVRGASAMVSSATRLGPALDGVLAGRAVANPEAGDVDGVVSLVVDEGVDAAAVARDVLHLLRTALPGATLSAAWAEGSDYLGAHPALTAHRGSRHSPISLPTVPDVPMARRCGECELDAARGGSSDEGPLVCVDCDKRTDAAGSQRDRQAAGLGAESRLLADLAERGTTLHRARTFEDLARLGPDRKANHLATVAIDGNDLGGFFSRVATTPGVDRAALTRAVSGATRASLVDATAAVVLPEERTLPVVPHVVGGDDVLVSLPARRALLFVTTFLTRFGDHLGAEVERIAPDLVERTPTASAGLVVAHVKHPFSRCQALAHTVLRQAKAAGRGRVATVLWADVTRWGERSAPFDAWTVADLAEREVLLGAMAGLPHSTSTNLARRLAADDEVAMARLRTEARRLGLPSSIRATFGDDVDGVRAALDLARWWWEGPGEP